jgi:hypothetical protein
VDRPADLLVEQDVAGEFLNLLIGANGKLTQVTRSTISI